MEGMDSADILRDPVPDGSTLTGQLLVATPEISAGVFHRAVVLVLPAHPDALAFVPVHRGRGRDARAAAGDVREDPRLVVVRGRRDE